ncbi:tRNA (adenosine(37)-N6)-threonylcarbamoyltransferase complex ATPase subunit type 1 TsaE [Patescibacteria group bacterium]|nr:tRNA (adenosine(37)-N6)-threonylcarbamoyltransferase complex ATPase subunit type 1 TsaE [Patescibacteria group bacterium]MBU4023068.1 tRNA (adenosine(37)-N6)-threonylcarbamoyltransferase complex ATPase subunit type 1 TsaE [Patescibacteria group bacterium]MBU4078264.1 tRNA (adenosine(37)-N6)-threonylcarbamoyltransferase complex ATPase subunit type 1 TsaE [Patescibacteria group bacterium]
MTKKFITKSALGTKNLGKKIAQDFCIQKGAIILGLKGDLGAGKTTFVQGVAHGLEISDKILSPTFVILKKFKIFKSENKFQNFFHIDCYRIENPKEILDLGFKEIILDPKNIVIIEWPEKIKTILPEHTMFLNFKFVNINTREIKI